MSKLREKTRNQAILLLGSNIDPEKNIFSAIDLLGKIKRKSHIWKTEAFGSKGPDFLNMAVEIDTNLDKEGLKKSLIGCVEKTLRRERTADKNAPRTIDLDIITFNGVVFDEDVWNKAFVAIPVSELVPDLENPKTKEKLIDLVKKLKSSANAELYYPDLNTD